MISEEDRLKGINKIIELRDSEKGCRILFSSFSEGSEIKQGQFVFTLDPFANPLICVGYVIQIRKRIGPFNSDSIFLRLANGKIQEWANQGFFSMSEEQEVLARQIFAVLPEDEDYSTSYWSYEKVHEIGFIVENPKPVPSSPTQQVSMTIKEGDQITNISFI